MKTFRGYSFQFQSFGRGTSTPVLEKGLPVIVYLSKAQAKTFLMVSTISWSSFLIFLVLAVVAYYGILAILWYWKHPKSSKQAQEKKEPVVASVNPELVPAGRVELTQESLATELRRWLFWSNHQGFDRRGILLAIETHLNEFGDERVALSREAFNRLLVKTLYETGSITLTEEEMEQLWKASAPEPTFSFRPA